MSNDQIVNPDDIINLFNIVEQTLKELNIQWALVGGLAVSTHADPRFTNDIDLSVSVSSDIEVENIIFQLQQRQWRAEQILEEQGKNYISTVRFTHSQHPDIFIDLLFASSGIETEIVMDSIKLEALPNTTVHVAQLGHLLALKVLSEQEGREQDTLDIRALLREANVEDLQKARDACKLITERGFHRKRDLLSLLENHIHKSKSPR